jgi:hypothetical protein
MIDIALIGTGRMARVHAAIIRAAAGDAIDGPRATYLAEASGAFLWLGVSGCTKNKLRSDVECIVHH